MTRKIWIVLGCIVLCAGAAGAWRLWHYWYLHSTLIELSQADDLDQPLRPDSRHLAAIRKLRFTWDNLVESGGPTVDPLRDDWDSPPRVPTCTRASKSPRRRPTATAAHAPVPQLSVSPTPRS